MIFFKTKGQDFCGAAVAEFPLGWSATVTAALPDIVDCRAPSRPLLCSERYTEKSRNEQNAVRGSFQHYYCFLSILARSDVRKTLHRPLVLVAHRTRLFDIQESHATPTRGMVAAGWLLVLSI